MVPVLRPRLASNDIVLCAENSEEKNVSSINLEARLAQLAARRSHNPKVVGSIPTLCTGQKYKKNIFCVGHYWRSR